jgi:NEDD8-activating enzyme E1 regulatory subunit
VADAYKAYTKPGLTADEQELVDAASKQQLTADSTSFHFLLRALADFVQEHNGLPPLAGDIPDMTSETDAYVELQQLYKAKAEGDVAGVTRHLARHLAAVGAAVDAVPAEEVALFCRNVHCLMLLSTRTLADELEAGAGHTAEALAAAIEEDAYSDDAKQTPALWYFALRAADAFQSRHGRYPGESDSTVAADTAALQWELAVLVKSMGLSDVDHLSAEHAKEIVRYGACELHTTAAVVGGIASQEAVKAITHQYAPLNNTVIYNGIAGVMGVYQL